jgi:hypothetical protein
MSHGPMMVSFKFTEKKNQFTYTQNESINIVIINNITSNGKIELGNHFQKRLKTNGKKTHIIHSINGYGYVHFIIK